MRTWTILLLVLGFVLPLSAQEDQPVAGRVTIPYLYGDAGMVALQAGETLPVTWSDAPPNARIYIFLWRSYFTSIPSFIGVDIDPADGVSVQWKIPEHLGGMPYGIAVYADGTRVVSDNRISGLEYGSGSAPPDGICSVRVSNAAPEVFDNQPNAGEYRILGYMHTYAPALEYLVDSDGFPWIRIDLTQPDVITPLDDSTALPETGWIYAHGTRLFGDCGFLDEQ